MTTMDGPLASSTVCLICGTANSRDAVLCRDCSAPLALVREIAIQRREPRLVSVVGESNVGKTVYIGFLLDMLSQRAGDFEAIPKGAYSIDIQQAVISHMSHRTFPPKTVMEADQWYWAYYQVRRRAKGNDWVDLVMPDMAGEALAAEMASPKTFRVISNLVTKSSGTLLLVDAGLAANGSSRPDFFALKMMSYIDSMNGLSQDQRIKTPVAVVLAKADYCPECFDDPEGFVEANLNRLWNMCQSRFENVEYFACSVVGSLGYATSKAQTLQPERSVMTTDHQPVEHEQAARSEWERRFAADAGGMEEIDDISADGQTAMPSAESMPAEEDFVVPIPLHTALRGVLEPFEWIIDQI